MHDWQRGKEGQRYGDNGVICTRIHRRRNGSTSVTARQRGRGGRGGCGCGGRSFSNGGATAAAVSRAVAGGQHGTRIGLHGHDVSLLPSAEDVHLSVSYKLP